jgi:beta-mannosidase
MNNRSWPTIDLNGTWSFAYSLEPPRREMRQVADLLEAGLTARSARVPGNFELDLQAAGIIGEPFYGMNMAALKPFERAHIWYWRTFQAEAREGHQAVLVFEGLDCLADIYLNGHLVGRTDNMLIPHTLCVEGWLNGDNEILVHIRPAVEEAKLYEYPPALNHQRPGYESLYIRKAPQI